MIRDMYSKLLHRALCSNERKDFKFGNYNTPMMKHINSVKSTLQFGTRQTDFFYQCEIVHNCMNSWFSFYELLLINVL